MHHASCFPFHIFHVGGDNATLPVFAPGSGPGFACCSFRDSQLASLLIDGMTYSHIYKNAEVVPLWFCKRLS